MNEKSVRVRFILDSLVSFLLSPLSFIVFSSQLLEGVASALVHFQFFSCVSITLHICLGDILIKINLSSYSPSQTVTTTAIQTTTKRKALRRVVILFSGF